MDLYSMTQQWPFTDFKIRRSLNFGEVVLQFVQLFRLGRSGFLLSKFDSIDSCKIMLLHEGCYGIRFLSIFSTLISRPKMTMHFDHNEEFIFKIYSYRKFFNKGAMKLYFVFRSQDASHDFSYELIYIQYV
jgi:hypothetical protein